MNTDSMRGANLAALIVLTASLLPACASDRSPQPGSEAAADDQPRAASGAEPTASAVAGAPTESSAPPLVPPPSGESVVQAFGVDCDDHNPCTQDVNLFFACLHLPQTGQPCNDELFCTENDRCVFGKCVGTKVHCPDGPCTKGVCDEHLEIVHCTGIAKPDNTLCDDGQYCTTSDMCRSGVCVGYQRHCPGTVCRYGACDEDQDQCKLGPPRPDTTKCNDGSLCTTSDHCSSGTCTGTRRDCSGGGSACSASTCNEKTGACVSTPKPSGTPCPDSDLCNGAETCDGTGTCLPGQPKDCSVAGDCVEGVCHPADGSCATVAKQDGTACDDGNLCTVNKCLGGACASTEVDCSTFDAPCAIGTCDAATGACAASPRPLGTPCPDGDACNGAETCDGAGTCSEGQPVVCGPHPDPCQELLCNPLTGSCDEQAKPEGATCVSANKCLLSPTCQGGACVGELPDCSAFNAPPCIVGTCDAVTGACKPTPRPTDTPCDTDGPCNGTDVCIKGVCVADVAPPEDDQNGCTADACVDNGVIHTPIANLDDHDPLTIDLCRNAADAIEISHIPVPELDRSVVTTVARAGEFIHTAGVQTGVTENIDAQKAGWIRGRVRTAGGSALPGIPVSLLGHPEYGSTVTQGNGDFDLIVNGGSSYTVYFDGPGYLPAQRTVAVAPNSYARADDLVLIQPDLTGSQVSFPITTSGTMAVVRSTAQHDARGSRRARLFFPEGTNAQALTEGQSPVDLIGQVTVRLTEYSTGDDHVARLPVGLPEQSPYSYVLDLHIDEAGDADTVEFDSRVVLYVNNFLHLRPSMEPYVRFGHYDRNAAQWESYLVTSQQDAAIQTGRVLSIVGVDSNGLAMIDLDGDGEEDPNTSLPDDELRTLAQEYVPGDSLIRFPMPHLSIFGFGACEQFMPFEADDQIVHPSVPDPKRADARPPGEECKKRASIIGCQTQSLSETVPVAGTPFRLDYHSDRTRGNKAARRLHIPVWKAPLAASITTVTVKVTVAGHDYPDKVYKYPQLGILSKSDLAFDFDWDGRAGPQGQLLQGSQPTRVSIGYTYEGTCTGGVVCYETKWKHWDGTVGGFDALGLGLGGWMLSAQHVFDPRSGVEYGEDTKPQSDDGLPEVVTLVAGAYKEPPGSTVKTWCAMSGDGGPALGAQVNEVRGLAFLPDQSFYVLHEDPSTPLHWLVRWVKNDGTIETPFEFSDLDMPSIAVGPAGELYVGGNLTTAPYGEQGRVYRGDPPPFAAPGYQPHQLYMGGGDKEYKEPGYLLPPGSVKLEWVNALAVAADGTLFVAEQDTDNTNDPRHNIVSAVHGGRAYWLLGCSGSLCPMQCFPYCVSHLMDDLVAPFGLAVDGDGSLFVSWDQYVTKLTANGSHTVIGGYTGPPGFSPGDVEVGEPATNGDLHLLGPIAADGKGGVYFVANSTHPSVQRIGTDGILRWAAGWAPTGCDSEATGVPCGEGEPPGAALEHVPGAIATLDGSLYLGETCFVRKVGSAFLAVPSASFGGIGGGVQPPAGSTFVPSKDGSSVYEFDYEGRHRRTLDRQTGAEIVRFEYLGGRLKDIVQTTSTSGTGGTSVPVMIPKILPRNSASG